MHTKNYDKFYKEIIKTISEDRVLTDPLLTLAYGTDASFYRLIPEIVIKVRNENEIVSVIKTAANHSIPLTFRAAGTSLSGQAITNSVLVVAENSWNKVKTSDDGESITLQPSVIGAHANLRLTSFHKKLGPDPASINSCKIAGIAANNASGMTSGTKYNIYNTLSSMRIVFADGTVLDTGDKQSKTDFTNSHPSIIDSIVNLGKSIRDNEPLRSRIQKKYAIKNTTGYGLNSLIDFEDPFDIICHLMIGSEGTLGYISEITLDTVNNLPFKASALIIFKDIKTACDAIPIFNEQSVDAAEIMDRAALKSVEDKPGMPEYLKNLPKNAAALLIETSAMDKSTLENNISSISNSIKNLELLIPIEFTSDPILYKKLWDVRKGLFPSVCKERKPGTSVIIEDVNFPTAKLADAVIDLQSLFIKYGYDETIIWGHALAGNLHFVFAPDFSKESEVTRYKNFMDDIAKLVIDKYDGSLKAEHGTGRNMAPFVKYEWGEEAYDIMKQIKIIFDKENILNPGVLINDDAQVHIKNLKPLPVANPIIDKCIECGFCEINCPSKELTLTPRQRITSWREISRLRIINDFSAANLLVDQFNYYGNETCATDGLCALSCPVDIDTGKLIKELRAEKISPAANSIASFLASNMALVTGTVRILLDSVNILHRVIGTNIFSKLSKFSRIISFNKLPVWTKYLPKGSDRIRSNPPTLDNELKVVYFPSCITRTMGTAPDYDSDDSISTVMERVLHKAGFDILYPSNINNLCCGMAFSSKGFTEQGNKKSEELITALRHASSNWKYPVLFDMSPCLQRMKEYIQTYFNADNNRIKIYEQVEFINDFLLDKLTINKIDDTIALHITCSSTKMGIENKFKNVASACVSDVIIPENIGCCGFAGDRGFTFPELNKSALNDLKDALPGNCQSGYSNSRTCEIGLSEHSGINYKSLIYLVDKVSS